MESRYGHWCEGVIYHISRTSWMLRNFHPVVLIRLKFRGCLLFLTVCCPRVGGHLLLSCELL